MTAIPDEVLGLRVEVLRSARTTAALQIVGSDLQVRIPHHLADERVAAILSQKRPWIRGKVAELRRLPPPRTHELVSGESFPYLGRHYRLKVQQGHQVGVCLSGGYLSGGYLKATIRPTEQGEQRQARLQHSLQSWYRGRALERLQEKTSRYAQQIGVTPAGVTVRAFKARWGSCNSRGQLVFNWHIIKAPHSIVDYVVIHELCHLIHANHSKAFWHHVGHHDPAYLAHRLWLKQHGQRLLG